MGWGFMHDGRLIRVSKYWRDPYAVAYIVAIADPAKAIELIRGQATVPGDEVEDLGRVSDALIESLHLGSGQYKRA
jgi:hypothetical protein